MSNLYGVIGASGYKNLLADPQGANLISIPCTPGNGIVKAGTVMFRETSGMYSPAESKDVVNTNMLVVLKEDVNTGGKLVSGAEATAEDAAAYRAGRFIDGAVTLASDAAVEAFHKVVLRQQSIVFDPKEETGTFDNKVQGVEVETSGE